MTSRAADALEALEPKTEDAETPAPVPPVRNVGGRPRKDGSPAQPRAKTLDAQGRERDYASEYAARYGKKKPTTPRVAEVERATRPTRDEAADEAAKALRREFFAKNERPIKKALGDFYGLPFEIAAAASEVPAIELDAAKKAERADTLYWVLTVYCPDWTKHLPLLVLGGCVVADAGAAFAAYKTAKKVRPAKAGATQPAKESGSTESMSSSPMAAPADAPAEPAATS
jgi:hypothetical protein